MKENKFNKDEPHLYLYIMGVKNERDYIKGVVPFWISDAEFFFGPCKRPIRQELKENLLNLQDSLNMEGMKEIWIAGINPLKEKGLPRKLLFAGKIIELFTFKAAWNYYNKLKENEKIDEQLKTKINQMIDGLKNDKKGKIESPLLLKPVENGYIHRTDEHPNDWAYDLLAPKEIHRLDEINTQWRTTGKITRQAGLFFTRDSCFRAQTIFLSREEAPNAIELTKKHTDIIQRKRPGSTPASPFGLDKNGNSFGRLRFLRLDGGDAVEFINLIKNKSKAT